MDFLKQAVQRLGDDERGVSPVVGFVLMFAFVIILFSLYQTNVVPAQNEEVEFDHSQTVEKQISQLNDAIQQTGANGVPQSMTIATGVQYPDRALAINPGSPVGALGTSDLQTVTITGLSGDSGYWNDDPEFDTRLSAWQLFVTLADQSASSPE